MRLSSPDPARNARKPVAFHLRRVPLLCIPNAESRSPGPRTPPTSKCRISILTFAGNGPAPSSGGGEKRRQRAHEAGAARHVLPRRLARGLLCAPRGGPQRKLVQPSSTPVSLTDLLKLTVWCCGTNPPTWERKRARSHETRGRLIYIPDAPQCLSPESCSAMAKTRAGSNPHDPKP